MTHSNENGVILGLGFHYLICNSYPIGPHMCEKYILDKEFNDQTMSLHVNNNNSLKCLY